MKPIFTEKAERELRELIADDTGEKLELTAIYVARGLDPSLAKEVAEQLMIHDALGALRLTFWGALAMALTASVGYLRTSQDSI